MDGWTVKGLILVINGKDTLLFQVSVKKIFEPV